MVSRTAYTLAIPRAALSSSYSLWLHWRSPAVSTALRHRSRNASAPSQEHSRAKASESTYGNNREKTIIKKNEHAFVYYDIVDAIECTLS